MTTAADLVRTVRRHIEQDHRQTWATTTALVTDTATSLTLSVTPAAAIVGRIIEVGFEQMLVTVQAGAVLTVVRGFDGTEADAHAAGSAVRVDPRPPAAFLVDMVNAELADLSGPIAGLYQVRFADLAVNDASTVYPLAAAEDPIRVLQVQWRYTDGAWHRIEGATIMRNMPTTESASTVALILKQGAYGSGTIRVTWSEPFGQLPLDATADVEAMTGITPSMRDIVEMGAAARAVAGREVARTSIASQGDTRRPNEVPAGMSNAATRALLALRTTRIAAEAQRLRRQWPEYTRS